MLNYGRTKQSLFQEAHEADRDTLHAVARDSVYRRRLGALAHKKDGTPTSQAASAIFASFRTAGQIAENGMPKEKFENSVVVFYFIHDVPGTDDLADTSRIIEMAQIASLWYCRVADNRVSFTLSRGPVDRANRVLFRFRPPCRGDAFQPRPHSSRNQLDRLCDPHL
jgi:hypothetical protein